MHASTRPPPALSVAICTNDRGHLLIATLTSLLPQSRALPAEVLVIDQQPAHDPQVTRTLEAWQEAGDLRWLAVATDSLTGKRNIALREAAAPVLVFIDDDVILPPDYLAKLHTAFVTQPWIGLTGQVFHALDPDHPPALATPAQHSRAHFIETTPMATRSFIGCNHAVRVDAARAIGGYDEAFIASSQCEDFDFADRLADAGHLLWYDPGCWLIHLRARSGGTRDRHRSGWPEWTRTANVFLYAFRHGRTHHNTGSLLVRALRTGPLRKEIVIRPWRWPLAWWGCARGAWYGWKRRVYRPACRG